MTAFAILGNVKISFFVSKYYNYSMIHDMNEVRTKDVKIKGELIIT